MLHVHRSERADGLLAALAATLGDPAADPFAPEVVAVPTKGVERWIAQSLSTHLGTSSGRHDGVCANVRFPSPRRLLEDALAAATGIDPAEDPWRPERALWPLLEVVDAHLVEWPALARHAADPRRRLATVRHVAELFDRYAIARPDLVRGWARGEGEGWQPRLWRRLRDRLDVPSPAERLVPACARLRAEPDLAELPPRLSVFGLTRLPASRLPVLEALAEHRDVHLHLLHPSAALWSRLVGTAPADPRRAADPTRLAPEHPLLRSWGTDARELQLVLARCTTADHHHPAGDPAPTLLGRLQADVRGDVVPGGVPAGADGSLTIHACHGRARQVEVLRDAILHLLEADASLELRDIVVMCPDIERFAPLVQATFATAGDDGDEPLPDCLPELRVRLADRSLRQTNPVLGVVARLLELAEARVTASEVLDLADRAPVRRRFRLDDDDVARMEGWAADAGVRWGFDGEHRAPFGLRGVDHGTWRRGLDRILLGAAMTEDGAPLVGGVLPLDDVPGGDLDLAGRLAELLDRLEAVLTGFRRRRSLAAWTAALAQAADGLTDVRPGDAWQRLELDGVLADAAAAAAGSTIELSVAEVRDLLADRLAGRPTRANFRTGHLTFCTLHPMRAVPHRVVCLLGLDDDVFPRGAPRDGDDLTLAEPHVGDRDGRLEDRQLLLDALLSATDRLLVTFGGRDERTNAARPPAVPVGELLDVVERTAGPEARAQVLVEHPLQAFDPRAFDAERPWGFDAAALAGARALVGPRTPPSPFLEDPLAPAAEPGIDLQDLVAFVQSPVKAFLRHRLLVAIGASADDPADDLSVELEPLEVWALGQRMLEARLAGVDERTAILAERGRGTLPPGKLGAHPAIAAASEVRSLLECAEAVLGGLAPAAGVDVRTRLPDGRRLGGTVPGVAGDVVRAVSFSRLGPKHRLAAWVRLLALATARPDRPWTAVTIGRRPKGPGVLVARVGPLDRATAERHLLAVVDLRDRGLREPLPMACRTSAAYATAEGDPEAAARDAWTSGFEREGEDAAREHVAVWGTHAPLDVLLAAAPRADEAWSPEPTRFGRLARRLWDGLLEHEGREPR